MCPRLPGRDDCSGSFSRKDEFAMGTRGTAFQTEYANSKKCEHPGMLEMRSKQMTLEYNKPWLQDHKK